MSHIVRDDSGATPAGSQPDPRRRNLLALGLAALTPIRALPVYAAIDYPEVAAGTALAFPADFGAHPRFRVEWWYVTGWLASSVGFQVTFFRVRPGLAEDNPSRFAPSELVLAHAAIADPGFGRLRVAQRAARQGFGLAGAATGTTRVWIDAWSLVRVGSAYRAAVAAEDFALELDLVPTQPMLLEGDAGVSRKGPDPGDASFYYSEPQLSVRGKLALGRASQRRETRDVKGVAWLDHEWSSPYLPSGAAGWDWTGINFDDGRVLMAFRIRNRDGTVRWKGATFRDAAGHRQSFDPGEVAFTPLRTWHSPRTGIGYPVAMRVTAGGVDVTLEPLIDDQELDARATTGTVYWEGAVRVHVNASSAGRGYLELTGYGVPLRELGG